MNNLPPPPRLRRQWADRISDDYPYSSIIRNHVNGIIPEGLSREDLIELANRYSLYLARNNGNQLTFDQIRNLDQDGNLGPDGQLGGAKKRKSKKTSKKVSKKRSSKKTKSQVGGAKKRKSKKTSKKSSKKTSKK